MAASSVARHANAVESTLMKRSRNTFWRTCCGSVRSRSTGRFPTTPAHPLAMLVVSRRGSAAARAQPVRHLQGPARRSGREEVVGQAAVLGLLCLVDLT